MTRRRELRERIETLGEIEEILGAMKNLAFVEVRRIEGFIDAQRAAVSVIEDALADVASDRGDAVRDARPGRVVLCVIGSERGFCGDFNRRVADEARRAAAGFAPGSPTLLVGERLRQAWPDASVDALPGPSVADEVPQVLQAIVARLPGYLTRGADPGAPATGVVVVHHCETGCAVRTLIPVPDPPRPASPHPYPVLLNLPPARFVAELSDQYLDAALQRALHESLLEENRRRLEQMDRAVDRLRDRIDALGRRGNRLRQEEITEEIEEILLSAQAGSGP